MTALGWALPGLPLVAGALLLVAGRRADTAAPAAGVAAAAGTLALAIGAAIGRPVVRFPLFEGMPAGLAVDGLSAAMVVTVAAATLAVLVFAAGDLPAIAAREGARRDRAQARFFGLMLVFTAAMLVTVTATDLAVLLMAWEVMGAMSYALIGLRWWEGDRVRSGNVAFLTTRTGDLGLYLAAGCAIAGAHTLSLDALAGAASPWRDLIAAGIIAAALGKSAQLPFSFWLSRAMAGPSPVSALLHSATMVAAGAYLLLRVHPLPAATGWAGPLVAWTGAATALLLGAVALAQRDLKQLLAASTCAQVGFMVLAAGVASVAGGAAHLAAHAAVKSLLFLCAGAWLTALGTQDLGGLYGAARRHPLVGVTFGVGALALAGVPPLSLWLTKDAVLAGALKESWPLYLAGLAASVLATAYAARALFAVWRPATPAGTGPAGTGPAGTGRVGWRERLPLPVLACAAAVLGVSVAAVPAAHRPSAAELLVSGLLAVLTLAAVHYLRPVSLRPAVQWLYLERAAWHGVARPVLALARVLARFDDLVIDGGVRAVATGGRRTAALTARRAETPVNGLVEAAARTAGRLGALARRPQTGQAHTYYAQAAVLLIVLAIVVVLVG